jgi:exodeoxyribonuclease III
VLSVLTVNIGAASPERARLLLGWLAGRPEEVLVITETSAGPGTSWLLGRFRRAGFAVIKTPDTGGERGSALVSRVRVARDLAAEFAAVSIPCRVSAAVLATEPAISVIGVYVPSRDRSAHKTARKQQFIHTLVEACDKLPWDLREHVVLGGDYNVIGRAHRPLHPGFLPFEFGLLDTLRERGLADAYEHTAPGDQPYSWIGRTGDGYRYDYLHVGPGLTGLIGACSYLHETRQLGLTDHAAMTLTLHADATPLETGNAADTEEPAADGALTLF